MFFPPSPFFRCLILAKTAKADYGRKKQKLPICKNHYFYFKETLIMAKRFTSSQIVSKLRQADVLIGQGKNIPDICRELEISQQTYYRWRQKYGGMSPDMVKEYRQLRQENQRLRQIVADQIIDMAILKEAAKLGNS
jgi:putative transposase